MNKAAVCPLIHYCFICIILVLSLYTRSFYYVKFGTLYKGVLKSCFVCGNVSISVVGIL